MDIAALPHVSIHKRVNLPNISAVYFILDGDGLPLYIGQSYLMRNRWEAHPKKLDAIQLGGWRIAWKAVPRDRLSEFEREMIELFQPVLNLAGTSRDRRRGPRKPARP